MADGAGATIAWLQEWLPRGIGLTEASWAKRHRNLVIFLWCHVFGLPILGLLLGNSLLMSVSSVAAIGCCAILTGIHGFPRRVRSAIMGVGLALSSSVLVHLSGGYIEMHFHYFVILPLLMLYQDWIPFLVSAVFVAGHHLLAGLWFPHSVFNHPDALAHPLLWAGVHVLFFGVASVAYLVTWRSAERHVEALRASEEQLQLVIHSANDGIWDWNIAEKTNSTSVRWKEILGYQEGELADTESSFFNLVHPDDRATVAGRLRQHLDEHVPYAVELRMRHKDGQFRWFLTRGEVIRNEAGQPVRMVGSLTDITERKKAEERLRQSEAFLDSVIEHLPNLVFVKEADGLRHIRFNTACEQLLGVSRQEVLGKNNYDFFPAELADLYTAKDRDVLTSGRMVDIPEEPIQTKDKGLRFLHTKKVPICDADGVPRYLLGISEDITEYKEAEERLRQSEAFLDSVIEHLPNMVFVKDAKDLRFVRFNKAGEELLGRSRESLLGKNDYDFFPKEQADFFMEKDRAVMADRRMLDIPDEPIDTADKGRRYLHTKKIPLYDAAGVPQYILGISEDITEQKQAEESLRESEIRFRQVVESAPNGMLMVRQNGEISLVNAQIERLFGYSRGELVGQSVELLLPPRFRAEHPANVQRFFADPSMRAMGANRDLFGRRKDGSEIPIEIGLTPLQTPEGPQVLASIIDITERKQAETALHARQTLLDAANKELEAFAYSVSHDLRAPLRGIDGFSLALLEDYAAVLDAQGQDYLRRVRSASQRMGQLIDDLLNLSRMTRREFRRETVDLSQLAQAVCDGLRQADPSRQVECSVAPGLMVSGDAGLLRIVLDNLLGNAWKFTGKRTEARIEFGAMRESGVTTYFVRDNGAGFDMAFADKLFAPFQRLHGMAEFAGTGIGLATVSRIIQRHGGKVWAEGTVGLGASVFFTVP